VTIIELTLIGSMAVGFFAIVAGVIGHFKIKRTTFRFLLGVELLLRVNTEDNQEQARLADLAFSCITFSNCSLVTFLFNQNHFDDMTLHVAHAAFTMAFRKDDDHPRISGQLKCEAFVEYQDVSDGRIAMNMTI
jgi:hypothetical protein